MSNNFSPRGARSDKSPDINFLHNARPDETAIPDSLKQYFTLVKKHIQKLNKLFVFDVHLVYKVE